PAVTETPADADTETPADADTETPADADTETPADTDTPAGAGGGAGVRRGWLLLVVMGGTFMAIMDGFIVNVAVPAVRSGLGASFAQAELTVSGYLLAYGLFLVAGGRLGDAYGCRRLFLAGLALFTAASLACGLAASAPALIAFRVVQALGAALFYPQVLAVLQTAFTGRRRARAFAVFGATIGGASVAGQLLGGLLVQADLFGLSWRPVFLLNVPLGLLLLLGAALTLPPAPRPGPAAGPCPVRRGAGLDTGGTLLLTAVLLLLLGPLTLGHGAGWPVWSVLMPVAAVPAAVLFVRYERALAGRGGRAVVDPGLFTRGCFGAGSAIAVAFFAGNAGLFFVLTLHLQTALGYGALRAGLCFLPLAVLFVLASLLAPRLQERIGTRLLVAGYAANAAGSLALLGAVVAGSGTGLLLVCLAVIGFGQGLGVSPLFAAALGQVPARLAGAASGVLETAAQIGMALGVTLAGLAFAARSGGGHRPGWGAFGAGLAVTALLALTALALVPRLLRHHRGTPAPGPRR
ncbi:MFS transporter, partial [Streptomyces sp. NRRL B-1347]|uniref:MFS transporter n=1 Tax=Streptomyces sp. NRRL B-1347 TaxID=1476877 RepID=UPI001F1CB282